MTRQVDVVDAHVTVAEARLLLDADGHDALPVLDESGCCVAIVSAGHDGAPSCPGAPAGILPVTTMGRRPVPRDPIRT